MQESLALSAQLSKEAVGRQSAASHKSFIFNGRNMRFRLYWFSLLLPPNLHVLSASFRRQQAVLQNGLAQLFTPVL